MMADSMNDVPQQPGVIPPTRAESYLASTVWAARALEPLTVVITMRRRGHARRREMIDIARYILGI